MNGSLVKVGIICPCPEEYQSCEKILKLHNETELAGRTISLRREKDVKVIAVSAGIGKISCASATQLIIDKFQPDFIFDVGGAGSLSERLSVNDIVYAKQSFEYDAFQGDDLANIGDELKTGTVFNQVSSQEVLKEFLIWVEKSMGFTIKVGDIASGDKDVKSKEFRQKLHEKLNAIACDWETSSVLKTAQLNGVKSLSFRVITDYADEKMNVDFTTNLNKALETMFPVLNEFLFGGWLIKI